MYTITEIKLCKGTVCVAPHTSCMSTTGVTAATPTTGPGYNVYTTYHIPHGPATSPSPVAPVYCTFRDPAFRLLAVLVLVAFAHGVVDAVVVLVELLVVNVYLDKEGVVIAVGDDVAFGVFDQDVVLKGVANMKNMGDVCVEGDELVVINLNIAG